MLKSSDKKDKKSILQFLPISLLEFSKEKNFTYKNQKLKTSYVIDLVHTLIFKYYFKRENKFHLLSTILKDKYGHLYNYYIDYLVEKGILILISKHLKGKSSRVYSLSETIIKSKIIRYTNSDKVLLKKIKQKVEKITQGDTSNDLIDGEVKLKLISDLESVSIDFFRSICFLDTLKGGDDDIYNRNRYSVECIRENQLFYHFDNYGRMHTNFTILKSFIRKNCLLIDGEETCEIDIKNSQPLFLTKLISHINTHWVKEKEFELFSKLTSSGKFYQFILEKSGIREKSGVKEIVYKVLFGRNQKNSRADMIFESLFPTIHHFIKLYKSEHRNYKVLAYDLQKMESNLIFNNIIREIMEKQPEIKVITVHDSLIIQKRYHEVVSEIFHRHLESEFQLL